MARGDRRSQRQREREKKQDADGEIRKLTKENKLLQREVARLRRFLDKSSPEEEVETEEVQEKKREDDDFGPCDQCGNTKHSVYSTFVGNVLKTWITCLRCGHRKKVSG